MSTTGTLNTATFLGVRAGESNSNDYNTGIGYQSLYQNTTGDGNTTVGYNTLSVNTTGSSNTAVGSNALEVNNGNRNTAIGSFSLEANRMDNNTAVGYGSLTRNNTGTGNTATGSEALEFNTNGSNNTAVGYLASSLNSVSSYSVAIGSQALYNNAGNANTASGFKSFYNNSGGTSNTAAGYQVGISNTSGSANTFMGYEAGYKNTMGGANTLMGWSAGYSSTTANDNAIFGYDAGHFVTGGENAFFGSYAGHNSTTGTRNTYIGRQADGSSATLTNSIAIGYLATVNMSNKAVIGNTIMGVIGGQVGWSVFSDGRFKKDIKQNVPGLSFINKLNPVTYHIELTKFEKFLGKADSVVNTMKDDLAKGEQKLRTGFIAQEVEKTAQEIGYDFDGVNHPQNDKDNYSIVYADFVPSLVKAVQELSKQNDDKDAKINDLEARLAKLETLLSAPQSTTNVSQSINLTNTMLEQNIPNPLSSSTSIRYSIPVGAKNAQLVITDLAGKTVKQITLNNTTTGNVNIDASMLGSGTYHYTLYADGKLIGSKKMIVNH